MRALNEPKTAKFEELGADFCVFTRNAPGLKLNFHEPYVDMPSRDVSLTRALLRVRRASHTWPSNAQETSSCETRLPKQL